MPTIVDNKKGATQQQYKYKVTTRLEMIQLKQNLNAGQCKIFTPTGWPLKLPLRNKHPLLDKIFESLVILIFVQILMFLLVIFDLCGNISEFSQNLEEKKNV